MSNQNLKEEIAPVSGSEKYEWDLKLYEKNGNCFISWSTTAPFRAQQGQIELYSGKPPVKPNPKNGAAWTWDNYDNSPFDTGKTWGSDWCAAWIAEKSPNGPYVYVAQTPLTVNE